MTGFRYAQVNDDFVCVAVSTFNTAADAPNLISLGDDENPIGHAWSDGEWIAPPPAPEQVPFSVTRRQILTGLAQVGWITEQEALDAITTGARPDAVDAVINSLPEDERFHARMKWAGFTEAYRDDPLVLALATAEGKTDADLDDFFRLCAAIQ
jgi:hypothetical protein